MLVHRETPVSNQVHIEPGIIHAPHFLQSTLACQPGAVRANLDITAQTQLLGKRALSVGNQHIVLQQASLIEEEAFHSLVNRFQTAKSSMLLLNLGPSDRHYYTRQKKAIVLQPGDLLVVAPNIDVFYGRCMLQAVFAEEKEDDTKVILFEGHF